MIDHFTKHPPRGEIVICLSPSGASEASEDKIDELLKKALLEMSVKDASEMVAKVLGLPKKKVYQRALEFKE